MSEAPPSEALPYGPARARQLRYLLVALGLFAPLALVPAVLVLVSSGLALRLLRDGRRGARWAAVGAGGVQVLLGVWMARSGLGIIPSIVGVLLLLLGIVVPIALVPAVLVLMSSGLALRLLADDRRAARWAAVGAGAVQVLLGVWMARSGLGIIPSIVGVLILLLALLPEADKVEASDA